MRRVRRIALLISASAALIGLCLVQALASHFAQTDPYRVLIWNGRNPDALDAVAALELHQADREGGEAAAARDARRALLAAPLDSVALRILGLAAEGQGDVARAKVLMEAGNARSKRDTITQAWLFVVALGEKNYADASLHSDAILRRRPEALTAAYPLIAAELADPRAIPPFVQLLAKSPDWRRPFLNLIVAPGADLVTAKAVFAALEASAAPPTRDEAAGLISMLISNQDYAAARVVWLRLDHPAVTRGQIPYDNDFEGLPGDYPFNWRMVKAPDSVAERAIAPDGKSALSVVTPASGTEGLAEQLLTLPAGPYTLSGEVLAASDLTSDLFSWRLTCLPDDGHPIAMVRPVTDPIHWRSFSVAFEAPERQCAAQKLRLDGLAHDQVNAIGAWFRAIKVRKRDPLPTSVRAENRGAIPTGETLKAKGV